MRLNVSKATFALLAIVVIGALWAWPHKAKEDPFSACVSKAVLETQESTRKLDVKVPGAIVSLFTGKGKSEPLDISVDGVSKEVYRKLTEGESSLLIAECARHYDRDRSHLDVTVQIWAELEGQQVDGVKVMRERNAGDDCLTHDGRGCTLTLHAFDPGTMESFRASYGSYEAKADYDAAALGKGSVTLSLVEHGVSRGVRVLLAKQVVNARVTVALPEGRTGGPLRSNACVTTRSFASGCDTAWTQGTPGQEGAFFLMPQGLDRLDITATYEGTSRRCVVPATTGTFDVDWKVCGKGGATVGPCPEEVKKQVSRLLDQLHVPSSIETGGTLISFAIEDGRLDVRAPSDALQRLAAQALGGRHVKAPACVDWVKWQVQ